MGAGQIKIAAAVAVGIDVHDRVLVEFVGVSFDPFCRTEETWFFTVPRAIDYGALGLPTLFDQFAERARFFDHGGLAGERIFRAIDPSIVVIAANDPLVGIRR